MSVSSGRFSLLSILTVSLMLLALPSPPPCGQAAAGSGLAFDGSDDHVTMGAAPGLGASAFTVECWFRIDGAGSTANTGSGGVLAIPLVTKGRGEADGSVVDMNYFLGVLPTSNVLVADFEEHTSGASPGLNHPVTGSTSMGTGVWHHAAATYDGSCWQLYLDGRAETSGTNCPGQPPNFASTQHFALGTALDSSGTPEGRLHGAIDEVRVWNYALSQTEINDRINLAVETATSLIGRWGLDEATGDSAADSSGGAHTGTVVGATWITPGAPFDIDRAPTPPLPIAPADQAVGMSLSPDLTVEVQDPDGDSMDVEFWGRESATVATEDFTIVALPDTQYYSCGSSCSSDPAIFRAQTQWIVDNREALNIVYVAHVGDFVEHGDTYVQEWINAESAMEILEDPIDTGLEDGIPYGIAVGNHDQSPAGSPSGTTTYFNQYFGESRFLGRAYYGGHYGADNDNHFMLFSAGGLDFVALHLEYDPTSAPGNTAVLAWAEGVLQNHATRRAIVVVHNTIGTGNPGSFSTQGQVVYDALKDRPNFFLMLAGHVAGEGRRTDTYAGNTVHTLMADYQGRSNGGNGWLRIMEFSPSNNEIRVRTYSPTLDQYETDADSQFTLTYDMSGSAAAFEPIDSVLGVGSGQQVTVSWPGLNPVSRYEWLAEASDATSTVAGPVRSFVTLCQTDPQCDDADPCTDDACNLTSGECENTAIEPCCLDDADCDDANYCTSDSCNLATHVCDNTVFDDGTPCDDGDLCTAGEACLAGTCQDGVPVADCCVTDLDCFDGNPCTVDVCPAATNTAALSFDGSDDLVSMGAASGATGLNAAAFTVETWFRWNSGGTTVSTGTGGVSAYPLVTKGRGESESATLNLNYFLGILPGGRLTADFEEHSSGTTIGLNHPVTGTTALSADDGLWHHAAATYNGSCWQLYLDGVADTDGMNCPGEPPDFESVQHFGLGTAFNSAGAASGSFSGDLDEVRVWGRALSQTEIRADMVRTLAAHPDLLGMWRLDEGTGAVAADTTGRGNNGAVSGATWRSTGLLDFGTANVCEHPMLPDCCVVDAECDDADPCTLDECVDNACVSTSDPDCCVDDAECDDGNPCTLDSCVDNGCAHDPLPGCCADDADCDDGDACTVESCSPPNGAALGFDGSDDHVTMGPAPGLNAATFTIETWFRWNAGGSTASTGTGGFSAYPLVTKGRGESESATLNLNYFLGILPGGQLAADFEEHSSGTAIGLNHPVTGTTTLSPDDGLWHHAAATYDGSCWQLYLDGEPEIAGSNCPGQPPDFESIQHFGLGTAFTSGGAASGRLNGQLDEVRVWDHALTQTEIQANLYRRIQTGAGLLGSWRLEEGAGSAAIDGTGHGNHGILSGGPTWLGTGLVDLGAGSCESAALPDCCTDAASCDDLDSCTSDACEVVPSAGALSFDGSGDYVTMGRAQGLGAAAFTIELWFRRDATGSTASTGTGGVVAVPLVTKGRGEADGSSLDMNYFLGIAGDVLAADFEDTATGLNHPVCATTPITSGTWHHAAATYDGACWQLYLDGAPVAMDTSCSTCTGGACTVCPGATPRLDSVQHFGIGTALTSTGAAAGAFAGLVDEVRVWRDARTASQVAEAFDRQIPTAAGLLGRWSFDDGTATDTSGNANDGTVIGATLATDGLVGFDSCVHDTLPDGTSCEDGSACTTGESCQAGLCAGGTVTAVDASLLLAGSVGGETALAWSDVADADAYNLYRGSRLPATAWSYSHACWRTVTGSATSDVNSPTTDELYYYLVATVCQGTESGLGTDSAGTPRPNPEPCVLP